MKTASKIYISIYYWLHVGEIGVKIVIYSTEMSRRVSALVGLPKERDALHRHLHAGLEVAELLILVVHREFTRVKI